MLFYSYNINYYKNDIFITNEINVRQNCDFCVFLYDSKSHADSCGQGEHSQNYQGNSKPGSFP